MLYSESGYAYVTDGRSVGHFDPQNTDPWQREHAPTENFTEQFVFLRSGVRETVRYTFPFRKMWQDKNYYLIKNGQWFKMSF